MVGLIMANDEDQKEDWGAAKERILEITVCRER